MAVPSSILPQTPPPQIRRAKKTKFCADCAGRIEAGTRYLECSPWRWTHLTGKCPAAS
jgi:hypothetical protein